jgi:hypothetical protein
VAAAVTIAEDVFQWNFTHNRGGSFPDDSRWLLYSSNPRVLDIAMAGTDEPDEEYEVLSLTSTESIVQHAVRLRTMKILEVLQELNTTALNPRRGLVEEKRLADMDAQAFSFNDMTTFGLMGTQLDELVREMAEKGVFAGWRFI